MATTEFELGALSVGYCEMNEADKAIVIEMAINALKNQQKSDKTIYDKDIAQTIKLDLDKQKGGKWNVIVGQSFGSFIAHETKTIIHFFVGNIAFLIWRYG
jgi:dynein light chain LC8-type